MENNSSLDKIKNYLCKEDIKIFNFINIKDNHITSGEHFRFSTSLRQSDIELFKTFGKDLFTTSLPELIKTEIIKFFENLIIDHLINDLSYLSKNISEKDNVIELIMCLKKHDYNICIVSKKYFYKLMENLEKYNNEHYGIKFIYSDKINNNILAFNDEKIKIFTNNNLNHFIYKPNISVLEFNFIYKIIN